MTPDQMADLHKRCFASPRPWNTAEFRDMLATRGIFACTRPGGFLIARQTGPEAELLTLAVSPDQRRQGLGRALMAAFETAVRENGGAQIFLEVAESNLGAIALYRSEGYGDAGYRKDYYDGSNGQKIAALVLTKDLSTG